MRMVLSIKKMMIMSSSKSLILISISSILSILCFLCYLSLETELETLRKETRRLETKVSSFSSSPALPSQEKLVLDAQGSHVSSDNTAHPQLKRIRDQESLKNNDKIIISNHVSQQLHGILEDASDSLEHVNPWNNDNPSPSDAAPSAKTSDSGLDPETTVIFYNRVPKTGSTTFVGITYEVCKDNAFHVIHVNTSKNSHVLSLEDQARFVANVSNWSQRKPALYHGHIAFLDFNKFGSNQKVIYINMLRDPIQRLVSYYYFLRFGDDFRPFVNRKRKGNKVSFDDCVRRGERDCDPLNMWLQIPFFCGHSFKCWIPGNEWALEQAKKNLLDHYLVVGVTEEMHDLFALLEVVLPRFFNGSTKLYEEGSKVSHLRKTYNKQTPMPETLDVLRQSKVWRMEQDFYEFARSQFHFLKRLTFGSGSTGITGMASGDVMDGSPSPASSLDETRQMSINQVSRAVTAPPKFFYDKLRPKYT